MKRIELPQLLEFWKSSTNKKAIPILHELLVDVDQAYTQLLRAGVNTEDCYDTLEMLLVYVLTGGRP